MADAGRVFVLFGVVVFTLLALRPDWMIKMLSYGTRDIRGLTAFQARVFRIMQVMSGFGVLLGVGILGWWLARPC